MWNIYNICTYIYIGGPDFFLLSIIETFFIFDIYFQYNTNKVFKQAYILTRPMKLSYIGSEEDLSFWLQI